MKIHLVDGTYELFRNHFGAPPKKAPDGREVGATLGLLRSLQMRLANPEVTHLACALITSSLPAAMTCLANTKLWKAGGGRWAPFLRLGE